MRQSCWTGRAVLGGERGIVVEQPSAATDEHNPLFRSVNAANSKRRLQYRGMMVRQYSRVIAQHTVTSVAIGAD